MKKFLFPLVFLFLFALAIPVTVFAHTQVTTTPVFSACADATTGSVDGTSITTGTASCMQGSTAVRWLSAGVSFTSASCTEAQAGIAQQENTLFCLSGVEPDGGLVYLAAIKAANARVIVGTPLSDVNSYDWGGANIRYVTFTSGFHAEYHSDNIVRFYNTLNQRVA